MLEAETAGTKEQLERAIARAAAAEQEVAQMRAALADLHVRPRHAAQCFRRELEAPLLTAPIQRLLSDPLTDTKNMVCSNPLPRSFEVPASACVDGPHMHGFTSCAALRTRHHNAGHLAQAAGEEVEQARGASSAAPEPSQHEEAETTVGPGMPDGARKEGSNPARAAGGEESASHAAAEGNDGADGVRRQLAAAADLAAAQLARELDDALRRHAATLEARTHHLYPQNLLPGAAQIHAAIKQKLMSSGCCN